MTIPLDNKGPLDRDVRHILSLSGLAQLPKDFELGVFHPSTAASRHSPPSLVTWT